MDTAITFGNDTLKIVRGGIRGGRVSINHYETVRLPEGVLVNGIITDEERLQEVLRDLRQRKVIDSSVRLSIDSSDILAKTLDVPYLREAELLETVRQEFDGLGSSDEMIYDYAVLQESDPEQKNGRILCCAMSQPLLDSYLAVFKAAKLQIKSADTVLNCVLKAITLLPELANGRFVLSFVRRNLMSCFLFADGQFLLSNRAALSSEPESEEYISEAVGRLSTMNQFYKAQKGDVTIEHAYFSELDHETFERFRAAGSYLGIPIENLPESREIICRKENPEEPFTFHNYLAAIGCLLRR